MHIVVFFALNIWKYRNFIFTFVVYYTAISPKDMQEYTQNLQKG